MDLYPVRGGGIAILLAASGSWLSSARVGALWLVFTLPMFLVIDSGIQVIFMQCLYHCSVGRRYQATSQSPQKQQPRFRGMMGNLFLSL